MSRETTWLWEEFPIGLPLYPNDDDLRGPRTAPLVRLTMVKIESGNVTIDIGITESIPGTLAMVTEPIRLLMQARLEKQFERWMN